MAASCSSFRTNLAAQTPFFDRVFLRDWHVTDSPVIGRHDTGVWDHGTSDVHFVDRVVTGQPNLNNRWQAKQGAGSVCAAACDVPRVAVSWGTQRSSYYMEGIDLYSQLLCLDQLRYSTKPDEQMAAIYKGLKTIPENYTSDFLQVHAVDMNAEFGMQIASQSLLDAGTNVFYPDITPDVMNIQGQLTEINLGGSQYLPTSALTFPYLDYLTSTLMLRGYNKADSGLPMGMYNLLTDPRTWARLTNGNPSMKDMMAFTNPQQASPLYKIGQGTVAPFGNYAATLNPLPIRFQHVGNGVLNRVYPFINQAADTGLKPVVNPAWIKARYQISYIWHPKAIKMWTPDFGRINEMVPSVNSALYGKWDFKNGDVLVYVQPDGTTCTINNDKNNKFYWLCALELGFQYVEPQLLMPILHLVDGSGLSSIVDDPVCGTAPAYVVQDYSNSPLVC